MLTVFSRYFSRPLNVLQALRQKEAKKRRIKGTDHRKQTAKTRNCLSPQTELTSGEDQVTRVQN